jgi:hypothetical protein
MSKTRVNGITFPLPQPELTELQATTFKNQGVLMLSKMTEQKEDWKRKRA